MGLSNKVYFLFNLYQRFHITLVTNNKHYLIDVFSAMSIIRC